MSARLFEMLHPHFSPDITLGHLLQAGVVIITGGGGILAGYLSLRSDIDMARAEYRVGLAGHEARLMQAERQLDERRQEERQFQSEMRAALERVMQTLADMRAELVQKQNRR
ncbi:MAG: TolC family protein [Alphaproteobacteria bacterium]|nr:TolC family protein [Alphaproteobacteria bacterium]MBV9551982.1 TolC family protein [Alphaproteobacteria bacterium]